MNKINKNILIFVENLYEDLELQYPKIRLKEAGADVKVAGPKKGETYKAVHGLPCVADLSFDEVNVNQFDGLVIPGGYAPDKLRKNQKVLDIVKKFNEEDKLIAFICHAGWVPISAGVIDGVRCTSVQNIKDDLINAGAKWEDKEVVIDKHFISSRTPDDLPFFCPAIIEFLSHETIKQR
jgi:protease I